MSREDGSRSTLEIDDYCLGFARTPGFAAMPCTTSKPASAEMTIMIRRTFRTLFHLPGSYSLHPSLHPEVERPNGMARYDALLIRGGT
jgi:hypothetical protein